VRQSIAEWRPLSPLPAKVVRVRPRLRPGCVSLAVQKRSSFVSGQAAGSDPIPLSAALRWADSPSGARVGTNNTRAARPCCDISRVGWMTPFDEMGNSRIGEKSAGLANQGTLRVRRLLPITVFPVTNLWTQNLSRDAGRVPARNYGPDPVMNLCSLYVLEILSRHVGHRISLEDLRTLERQVAETPPERDGTLPFLKDGMLAVIRAAIAAEEALERKAPPH